MSRQITIRLPDEQVDLLDGEVVAGHIDSRAAGIPQALRREQPLAAVTSTVRGRATAIPVGVANGLDHDSVINADNIFTIDHRSLGRRVGLCWTAEKQASTKQSPTRST